jgi:hypothetical protein
MVGEPDVFQQTPRARMLVPPSLVIFPPVSAVDAVIFVATVVVTVGLA